MASSQDKAIALKDAYVQGLVDATSEAPIMPEQDMGDQASVLFDMDRGTHTMSNDRDPNIYAKQNGRFMQGTPAVVNAVGGRGYLAHPLTSVGVGYEHTSKTNNAAGMEMQRLIDMGGFR